ncbi:VOC family protein [Streptomyces mirabilis]|uniref:VOC family protein n=1 Tax=Streptomyces mirabilis TaxID=68239 RepID=UPI003321F99F
MTDTSPSAGTGTFFGLPVHHVGYAVDDLDKAILRAVNTLGAGPFFRMNDIPLAATSQGEPAMFLHSAAFGQCGSMALEFMQIKRCEPATVADSMRQPTPGLNHIGFVAPSLTEARDELEAMGVPAFLQARIGDIEFTMHDARAVCGHNIEVHADNSGIRGFWQQVRDASIGWDGTEPIRSPSM